MDLYTLKPTYAHDCYTETSCGQNETVLQNDKTPPHGVSAGPPN